jgi:PGF-CTERM protein
MELTVKETGSNAEANREATTLNATDFTIEKDGQNETFYAVIPVDDLVSADEEGDGIGDWKATFSISKDYKLVDEDQSVSTSFTVEEAEISVNGGNDLPVPQGEYNVSGETNLAPGTELTLVANSPGVFYSNNDVTVNSDGTFQAAFDFSEYDNATEFDVQVSVYDNSKVDGVVNADMDDEEPNTTTTTTSSSEPTETTTNDDGQPGFGVAISVVALLSATLLALRREN